MKNFLIGMYGQFDENKYNRDFRDGFWGVEACMFSDKVQAKVLADKSKKDGFKFGVHFPLTSRNRKVRDPLFLSPDKDERDEAIEDFEDEAKYVSELGAEYILAHFPKPFIMDRKLDWKIWRFAD